MTKKTKPSTKPNTEHIPCEEIEEETKETNELEALQQELKIQKDKLIRCYADFDNYKKRILKEQESQAFDLKKHYLSELLDVKELLLQSLNDKDPKEGLRIIFNQLEQFLEAENIKYIDCIEKPFDHTLHHAVTTIDKPNMNENTVIEEIKKGYLVGESVLRPSHVIVSKKQCEEDKIDE